MTTDTRKLLLSTASLFELNSLSSSNNSVSSDVKQELTNRFIRVVAPYVYDMPKFIDFMRAAKSYISGSTALYYIFPHQENPTVYSTGHDLDIYITPAEMVKTIKHLTKVQGYRLKTTHYSKTYTGSNEINDYYNIEGIFAVIKFTREMHNIDVVVSESFKTCLLPLTSFHSTIVMNAISPDHVLCFYPSFTAKRISLINNKCFMVGKGQKVTKSTQIKERDARAIMKYVERGYKMVDWSAQCMLDHKCDNNRCRLNGTSDKIMKMAIFTPTITVEPVNRAIAWSFEWSLGGYPCNDAFQAAEYEPQQTRVVTEDEDKDESVHRVGRDRMLD